MADWEGLQQWARDKYDLENDEDTWFGVTLQYRDGRSQKVIVTHFTAMDHDWAEIRSPICNEDELAPKVALKKNAEFAVGALGLKDGKYQLSYSVLLEDLSEDEFEVPMNVIAASADTLEETYSGGNDDH